MRDNLVYVDEPNLSDYECNHCGELIGEFNFREGNYESEFEGWEEDADDEGCSISHPIWNVHHLFCETL